MYTLSTITALSIMICSLSIDPIYSVNDSVDVLDSVETLDSAYN